MFRKECSNILQPAPVSSAFRIQYNEAAGSATVAKLEPLWRDGLQMLLHSSVL